LNFGFCKIATSRKLVGFPSDKLPGAGLPRTAKAASSSLISPSLPSDGEEGWGGLARGGAFLLKSPLPGPLPARSSQGEDGELDAALQHCLGFPSIKEVAHREQITAQSAVQPSKGRMFR
jgi:hypothetical protein